MKNLIQYFSLIFLGLALSQSAFGQKLEQDMTSSVYQNYDSKGDQLYSNYGYKASIDAYLKGRSEQDIDMPQVANAYRLNHDSENAVAWYAKFVDETQEPIHILHYAQELQTLGKTEQAAIYYDKYAMALKSNTEWDPIAQLFAANVADSKRFGDAGIDLINERFINSKELEFSPMFYRNELVFVSTKKPEKIVRMEKDKWTNKHYMSLYKASKNSEGMLVDPQPLSYDITSRYHEGPATFNKSSKKIFFTRTQLNKKNKRLKNKHGENRLDIYTAEFDNDKWSDVAPLSFNSDEADESHPTLSPNGDVMIFSSNRKGGIGGMDLYISKLVDGQWTEPLNLGEHINTPGNEIFPFIHENGMLFFASNGHDGLGGLDIFSASDYENISGQNPQITNMGTPFNSNRDDFGFILDPEGKKGYLTSARHGGAGRDDIYSFVLSEKVIEKRILTICATDAESGAILPLTQIELELHNPVDNSTTSTKHLTNKNGFFELEINPGDTYQIVASRVGYEIGNISYSDTERSGLIETVCVPLLEIKEEPIVHVSPVKPKVSIEENVYFDFDKSNIIYEGKIILDKIIALLITYPEIEIEVGSHTDARGTDRYNISLSERRTATIVGYLLNNGITRERMRSTRYGEFRPWNECEDGIRCSESRHQENRRSHIDYFNIPDYIELMTIDNQPNNPLKGYLSYISSPTSKASADRSFGKEEASAGQYRIFVGSYSTQYNANNKIEKLKAKGFSDMFIFHNDDNGLIAVCFGNFGSFDKALQQKEKLRARGFKSLIKEGF